EDLARGYLAVALERRGDGLVVAMEDPGDERTVAGLEEVLGHRVLPAVAVRGDLVRLVEQMYGNADDDDGWGDGEAPVASVAAFVQRDSVGAVLRLVPGDIPAAEDLGLPDEVIEWVDNKRGLVLVCGPHGSGTSTTLAALVDRINRARACHILTIEQPIEF